VIEKMAEPQTQQDAIIAKQGLIKRLSVTGQLTRFMVYLAALIPFCVFLVLAILASEPVGILHEISIETGDSEIVLGTAVDYLIIGIIVATGVYGIYEFIRLRKVRKIDDRFPDFVRDLAESRRAGMTFTKAIMYSSRGNYGVLTPEIQKIARQISWGSSVDNALNAFAKRVNTKLIKRTISLIIEASRSGGNVADVLDAASKDAREIKLLESERRASMLSYVAVIYVGMMVFLVIIVVLTKTFLPNMLTDPTTAQQTPLPSTSTLTQPEVGFLFLTSALIQSGLMGVVTGVFEEGNPISGVKHTFIMLLITWIIFKFVVTGL
jgi:flagellar protein FlaJ